MSGLWKSSLELPVGTEIEFFQEDAVPVPDVPQVHKAAIDVADIPHFLVPEEFIIITIVTHSILTLAVLVLGLVLVELIFLDLEVIPLGFYLAVLLLRPKFAWVYMK